MIGWPSAAWDGLPRGRSGPSWPKSPMSSGRVEDEPPPVATTCANIHHSVSIERQKHRHEQNHLPGGVCYGAAALFLAQSE